jgi:hypothetical protein
MARRELLKIWNDVSFHNFPLRVWKETKNGYIYVMDGISLNNDTTNAICVGRYRFHTPKLSTDDICRYIWDVRKMKELVYVDGKEKEREYFCLENPRSSSAVAKHFMLFTSKKYEKVASKAELLAKVFCIIDGNNQKYLKLLVTTVPFNV